jgi:hypothetical protein
MKKPLIVYLIAILTVNIGANIFAFDGHRRGFVVGFGVGPGLTSLDYSIEHYSTIPNSEVQTKLAAETDLRVGIGFTDQWLVYVGSNAALFRLDQIRFKDELFGTPIDKGIDIDLTIVSYGEVLGVSHYFRREAPSPYVTAGLGFSVWTAPFESGFDPWVGFGFSIGAGYEFTPHWSVEGSAVYGNPSGDEFYTKDGVYSVDHAQTKSLSFRITANVLAY